MENEKTPTPKKGVRPRKRLDARLLRKVRAWLIDEERPLSYVLGELGLSVSDWDRLKETDDRLQEVLKLQRLLEEERVLDTLRNSKSHQVIAAMFLAKSRLGYVDKPPPPPKGDKRPNITIVLPKAAATAEEFERIEAGEKPKPSPDDDVSDLT